MKYLFFSLMAMLTLVLTGCKIDGEEEITIHDDGSAHLKMRYEVPGVFLSAQAADQLIATFDNELGHKDHLNLITNRVDYQKGQRIIHLEFEVDAEADLDGLLEVDDGGDDGGGEKKSDQLLEAIVGDLDAKIEGLSVGITRKVNLQPLLDEYMGKKSATMLGDFEFRYILHLPKSAEQNNAHQVMDGGKTLKWTYLLREMKKKPILMTVTAPIPIPWWIYAGVGFAGCLILAFVFWGVKKFRQKSIA